MNTQEELAFRGCFILVRNWRTLEIRAQTLATELKLSSEWREQYIAGAQKLLGGQETYDACVTYLESLGPGLYEVHKYGGFWRPHDSNRPVITSISFCTKADMHAWLLMIKTWYGPLGINSHVNAETNVVSI